MFKVEKRATYKDRALTQIRDAIKKGWLKPGERVNEAKLASDMGISRFPIREAIRSLEKEGLVVAIPFKGVYVNKLNEKDLDELYSLRILLEIYAVKHLVKNISKEKITELQSILDDMEKGIKHKKRDLISEDMKFHRKICELCDNAKLLEIWNNLSGQIRSFLAVEQHSHDSINYLYDSHKIILDAIKAKDSRQAQKRLRENIANGLKQIKSYKSFD